MKKFPKILIKVVIALLLLGVGVKFIYHFFLKQEEDESDNREPYQPEE